MSILTPYIYTLCLLLSCIQTTVTQGGYSADSCYTKSALLNLNALILNLLSPNAPETSASACAQFCFGKNVTNFGLFDEDLDNTYSYCTCLDTAGITSLDSSAAKTTFSSSSCKSTYFVLNALLSTEAIKVYRYEPNMVCSPISTGIANCYSLLENATFSTTLAKNTPMRCADMCSNSTNSITLPFIMGVGNNVNGQGCECFSPVPSNILACPTSGCNLFCPSPYNQIICGGAKAVNLYTCGGAHTSLYCPTTATKRTSTTSQLTTTTKITTTSTTQLTTTQLTSTSTSSLPLTSTITTASTKSSTFQPTTSSQITSTETTFHTSTQSTLHPTTTQITYPSTLSSLTSLLMTTISSTPSTSTPQPHTTQVISPSTSSTPVSSTSLTSSSLTSSMSTSSLTRSTSTPQPTTSETMPTSTPPFLSTTTLPTSSITPSTSTMQPTTSEITPKSASTFSSTATLLPTTTIKPSTFTLQLTTSRITLTSTLSSDLTTPEIYTSVTASSTLTVNPITTQITFSTTESSLLTTSNVPTSSTTYLTSSQEPTTSQISSSSAPPSGFTSESQSSLELRTTTTPTAHTNLRTQSSLVFSTTQRLINRTCTQISNCSLVLYPVYMTGFYSNNEPDVCADGCNNFFGGKKDFIMALGGTGTPPEWSCQCRPVDLYVRACPRPLSDCTLPCPSSPALNCGGSVASTIYLCGNSSTNLICPSSTQITTISTRGLNSPTFKSTHKLPSTYTETNLQTRKSSVQGTSHETSLPTTVITTSPVNTYLQTVVSTYSSSLHQSTSSLLGHISSTLTSQITSDSNTTSVLNKTTFLSTETNNIFSSTITLSAPESTFESTTMQTTVAQGSTETESTFESTTMQTTVAQGSTETESIFESTAMQTTVAQGSTETESTFKSTTMQTTVAQGSTETATATNFQLSTSKTFTSEPTTTISTTAAALQESSTLLHSTSLLSSSDDLSLAYLTTNVTDITDIHTTTLKSRLSTFSMQPETTTSILTTVLSHYETTAVSLSSIYNMPSTSSLTNTASFPPSPLSNISSTTITIDLSDSSSAFTTDFQSVSTMLLTNTTIIPSSTLINISSTVSITNISDSSAFTTEFKSIPVSSSTYDTNNSTYSVYSKAMTEPISIYSSELISTSILTSTDTSTLELPSCTTCTHTSTQSDSTTSTLTELHLPNETTTFSSTPMSFIPSTSSLTTAINILSSTLSNFSLPASTDAIISTSVATDLTTTQISSPTYDTNNSNYFTSSKDTIEVISTDSAELTSKLNITTISTPITLTVSKVIISSINPSIIDTVSESQYLINTSTMSTLRSTYYSVPENAQLTTPSIFGRSSAVSKEVKEISPSSSSVILTQNSLLTEFLPSTVENFSISLKNSTLDQIQSSTQVPLFTNLTPISSFIILTSTEMEYTLSTTLVSATNSTFSNITDFGILNNSADVLNSYLTTLHSLTNNIGTYHTTAATFISNTMPNAIASSIIISNSTMPEINDAVSYEMSKSNIISTELYNNQSSVLYQNATSDEIFTTETNDQYVQLNNSTASGSNTIPTSEQSTLEILVSTADGRSTGVNSNKTTSIFINSTLNSELETTISPDLNSTSTILNSIQYTTNDFNLSIESEKTTTKSITQYNIVNNTSWILSSELSQTEITEILSTENDNSHLTTETFFDMTTSNRNNNLTGTTTKRLKKRKTDVSPKHRTSTKLKEIPPTSMPHTNYTFQSTIFNETILSKHFTSKYTSEYIDTAAYIKPPVVHFHLMKIIIDELEHYETTKIIHRRITKQLPGKLYITTTPTYPIFGVKKVISDVLHKINCLWIIGTTFVTMVVLLIVKAFSYMRWLQFGQDLTLFLAHILILFLCNRVDLVAYCPIISTALQYLYICLFMFLFMESVQSYYMLTNVIWDGGFLSLKTCLFIGFISPILPTAITSFYGWNSLTTNFSCWLNVIGSVNYGTTIPLIILSSTIYVIIESIGMRRHAYTLPQPYEKHLVDAKFSRHILVFKLPANIASWVIGVLTFYDPSLQYFIIMLPFNIALGWFILTFHLLGNERARTFLKRLLKKMFCCKGKNEIQILNVDKK